MPDGFDPVDKIRLIHGLLTREVDEIAKMMERAKVNLTETPNPPMDIVVTDDQIKIFMDVPGLKTDNFTVYQYEDLIVIEGKCPKTKNPGNTKYIRSERDLSPFKRVFQLPENIVEDSVKAVLKLGVLTITIDIQV